MLLLAAALISQLPSGAPPSASPSGPPPVAAVRVPQAPQIDGRLDDPAWANASAISGFTQVDPLEGQPASEATEVRVVYTSEALYVGARLYDREPGRIERRLGRRDAASGDLFTVALDSYHDHRTAFQFTVNAHGVRRDAVVSDDAEFQQDDTWDPVWQAAVTVDPSGWVAELRIPFSQLRFPQAAEQAWGVNFFREVFRKNERSVYAFKLKTESGYASRFTHLEGLRGIPAPRRVEVLPYSVARGAFDETAASGDPFNDGSTYFGGAGVDLKYGVSSNLTLDASINPDFGQVEIDPAFVNLTAFEQFLQERRPFFVEGSSIFAFGGGGGGTIRFGGTPQYFYSRRIGRPPQGSAAPPTGGWATMPDNTTILGAAKLSGKGAGGWSVGVLDAVTAPENATLEDNLGGRSSGRVEPLTNYFVGRLTRESAGGSSGFGVLATAVTRHLDTTSLDFLREGAYALAADFFRRWARNTYAVSATFGASYVHGSSQSITRDQRASQRYYQRPDAEHLSLDTTRTSLAGISGDVGLSRISGNWTWGVAFSTTTPGFEVNDLGFQTRVDRVSAAAQVNRRWTRPGRVFRQANIGVFAGPSWNWDGDPIQRSIGLFHFGQFLNYWGYNVFGNVRAAVLDDRLTRGGPLAKEPAGREFGAGVFSDGRKRVSGDVFSFYDSDESGLWFWRINGGLSVRPSNAVSFNVGGGYFRGRTPGQFVGAVTDPTATATYGRRYVFGSLSQQSVDVALRGNVTLSPDLSFQLYMQPFSFSGDYSELKELRAPRTFDFTVYGASGGSMITVADRDAGGRDAVYRVDPDGAGPAPVFTLANPDFRTRSIRTNAVLRWEYRPGSTLFLVWTQSRAGFVPFDPSFSVARDFRRELFDDEPLNVLLVKLNYWLSL